MQAEVSGIGNVVSVEGNWDSLLTWLRDENEVHGNRYMLTGRSRSCVIQWLALTPTTTSRV